MHTVELNARARKAAGRTVRSVRRGARGSVAMGIGGIGLVVCAWAVVLFVPGGGVGPGEAVEAGIGSLVVGGVSVVLISVGRAQLGRVQDRDAREPYIREQHAFTITASTLEFPPLPGSEAQSWPLPDTVADVRSMVPPLPDALHLRCPGFAERRYTAMTLAESPARVRERVDAARRRLSDDR